MNYFLSYCCKKKKSLRVLNMLFIYILKLKMTLTFFIEESGK